MTGLVVAFLAYLVYNQNKERERERTLNRSLSPQPTSFISNEQLYDMIKHQQEQLDKTLVVPPTPSISNEQLYDMLKLQQERIDYIENLKLNQSQINLPQKNEAIKAGHISNLKSNPEDKIRKLKYNMI